MHIKGILKLMPKFKEFFSTKYRNIIGQCFIKIQFLTKKILISPRLHHLSVHLNHQDFELQSQPSKHIKGRMLEVSNKPTDYIYYDHTTEIVDRLRL